LSTDQDPQAAPAAPGLSRKLWWGLGATAAALLLWFFFAWLVLDRHILDAAGESVGTALALGILASLFGALRGSR
jgi:hypothetical protein